MSYMDNSCGVASYCANGTPRSATEHKTPERTPWELVAWAALEQHVDDVALLCKWGLITQDLQFLPWPTKTKFHGGYWVTCNVCIAGMRGPNEHHLLHAWFLSQDAQEWCDLIGCRVPAREIFLMTVKNHAK